MASRRTAFIDALEKSESKKDGGFKTNWSFSLSDASEEQANHSSRVNMDEAEEQREGATGGRQSPQLKTFTAGEHLKTYERKQANHSRLLKGNGLGLLKLGAGRRHSENPHAITPPPNRTNYFVVSHTPPQGVVVQGRLFQHANAPAVIGKSNLDLKERKDYSTQQIQRVELDSIILTCPEIPVSPETDVKRRVQQNRRRPFLEAPGSFASSAKRMEVRTPQTDSSSMEPQHPQTPTRARNATSSTGSHCYSMAGMPRQSLSHTSLCMGFPE